MRKIILAASLAASTLPLSVTASEITIGLSEHVVSANLKANINPHSNLEAGYIYSDKKGQLAEFAMHMTHQTGAHTIEIGPKWTSVWFDDNPDGSVISVGGHYSLALGNNISIHGDAYYAPSVLSFSDVDGYTELGAKVQYDFNPNMAIFIGYRNLKFKYDNQSNRSFEDGFYIGGTSRF
ncbi:YfaZ family protein [Shewanella sp. 10N.7]|uniref:YfaZ family outer membrane protein n=1 Tax=Shewanella sp. 10N.7 TaxID=2885093 RepID=UPI001E2838C9|nr:YfaZ family outer membrane protein [Shewanella sp. 10N.7]MCC4834913.1 YfaZ family protein [Shewanella sp. 10N.7]